MQAHLPKIITMRIRYGNRAFTVIELLAAAAIVGILAVLVVPFTGKLAVASRSVAAASQLRQIHTALAQHCADHNHDYPTISPGASLAWTTDTIAQYLPRRDFPPSFANTVFVCPNADYRDGANQRYANPVQISRTYAATSVMIGRNPNTPSSWDTSWPRHALSIREPARAMLVVDARQDGTNRWSRSVIQWSLVKGEFQNGADSASRYIDYRQSGKAHILFADGHVETMSPVELRERATQATWEAR